MINRTHRFHGYGSLRHIYRHGQTIRGPLIALRFMPNERRASYRAAVVVSRKVHKSAVVRNRIRRRIYEVIRQNESQITKPFDIVITVFSERVATLQQAELSKLVRLQLQQTGALPASKPTSGHGIVKSKES